MTPEDADRSFFTALERADAAALEALLADDFVIVEVMRGTEIARADFIGGVATGLVRFDAIDVRESRVRTYGDAAIVVGRTEMRGRINGEQPWHAHSRYTHVFVRGERGWRLASAQGTPIAGS